MPQSKDRKREYMRELMRRRRVLAKTGGTSAPASVEDTPTDQLDDNEPAAVIGDFPHIADMGPPLIKAPYQIAKETAERTKELLETRGWVLWKCAKLDNEVIVIIRDEFVTGYPPGLPFFTDAEVREFNQKKISLKTYKLLIEARKEDAKVFA